MRLWLAVQKVIHHDDVNFAIIRPRSYVAGGDPDSGDDRFFKENAKKGKARIAGRSRNETAEYQPAIAVKVLHPCAVSTRVCTLQARPDPVRLVDICEDRAEATDRCWVS